MGGRSLLPTEILDYVETHAPPADSPYGISQRELAKALGYHPCSMSRPLRDLVHEGLLDGRRGPVRDGVRKQLVYRVTQQGRTRLARETKRVPLLTGAIPAPPNPFLGRREELARLSDYSRAGGSIVLVDGPPGMGKTALMTRHLRRVKQSRIPFWFSVRPASSPRQFVSALSHALSFLGTHQLAYYSQMSRSPVPREVADLASRALGTREMVAVIDDAQMADPNLRTFLEDFVVELVRTRPDQVYILSQDLFAFDHPEVSVQRMTIAGLDRASAHELTDRRGGLAERFETVYQSTFGSPLLLQLAVSNPGLDADAATLPSRVVARLSVDDVRALLPIALSNEPLPLSYVTEGGILSSDRLTEVIRMGVVQRTTQGRLEILQVVKTALVSRVDAREQRQAHLTLADFYSGSHQPEAIRERFLHLVDAAAWKQAAQVLTQQERNILTLGYSEALRTALRQLSLAVPRGSTRVRVLLVEAAVLRHHSDYPAAIEATRRAIAESNEDPKVMAEGLLSIVHLLTRLQRVDEAVREFREAERIGPVTRRIQAFLLLSDARIVEAQGDFHGARAKFQAAFELARRFRISDLALESIAGWSRVEELEAGPEVVLRVITDALPEAREAGRIDIAFNLRLIRARAYLRQGHNQAAEEEMKLVRAEAESLGYLNQLTYSLSGLAAASIQGERWSEAMIYAKQACELADRLRNDLILGHSYALLSTAELRQVVAGGGPSDLVRDSIIHGEQSIAVLSQLPPSESLGFAHGYLADSYFALGNLEKAKDHYLTAVALFDKLKLTWLTEAIRSDLGTKLGLVS